MLNLTNLSIEQVTLLVVGILFTISLITGLISFILETDRSRQWWGDWFQGVSTEMVGAAMTTIFFTFIVGAVEQQQNIQRLKEDFGSEINIQALAAVDELARIDALEDGTLRGLIVPFANLQNAPLFEADLRDINLYGANLREAQMPEARFDEANLQAADMTRADLDSASLTGANLTAANLQSADLANADVSGANFTNANLQNAILENTRFTSDTLLPDSTSYSDETDLQRFTDPAHPDFWRPANTELWWYTDTDD
jgi:hypothetical protein